jgi:gliding motility-associated-like protein
LKKTSTFIIHCKRLLKTLQTIFIFLLLFVSNNISAHGGITFVENRGQWEKFILYKANVQGGAIFIEKDKITFHLRDSKVISDYYHGKFGGKDEIIQHHAYQILFKNALETKKVIPNDKTDEYFNYFQGNDKSKWAGGCRGFEEILYKNIYPNIDLKIYSLGIDLKYDFIIHVGGNMDDIALEYKGLDSLKLHENKSLYGYHSLGMTKEFPPVSFFERDKENLVKDINYFIDGTTLGYKSKDKVLIQKDNPLVIDPVMVFSCYSGSTADNFGCSAAYDEAGNLFGAGTVFDIGYPTTVGAYKTTTNATTNNPDIGITKYNATGMARIYSTYLGGNLTDQPNSLICDKNDRLLIFATTTSANYPTTPSAFDTSFNGGPPVSIAGMGVNYTNGADIVVTKFNPTGTGIIASTYFGGNGTDGVNENNTLKVNYGDAIRGEVLLDTSDNVYVVTTTNSTDIPTTLGCIDPTFNGGFDGLVFNLNPSLSALNFATYLGGSSDDAIYSIALDQSDVPVVAGGTMSTNFPVTAGSFDVSYNGAIDGFITKIKNTGDSIISSSYYGTADFDQIYFIELTRKDTIHVFGLTTNSTGFYVQNAPYNQPNSGQFVSKFGVNPDVRRMSTSFGLGDGDPDISPTAFLVDFCGKIYLAGFGALASNGKYPLKTTGLVTTPGAFQPITNNNDFYLMVLDDNSTKLEYASFYGGAQSHEHVDGGTSRFDKNGVMYHAVCAGCGGNSDLPIRPANSPFNVNGSSNCNMGTFKFDFGLPVTADFSATTACAPNPIKFTNLSHSIDTNAKFVWYFGDGTTSNAKNPNHIYTTGGIYNVMLIIFDTASCNSTDTINKNVVVLQSGKNTNLGDKVICPNGTVRIGIPNVKDPLAVIKWTPTAGLDDTTILTPYASPLATTTYKLYISKNGCTDTFTQKVIIKAKDVLNLRADTLVCKDANTILIANNHPKAQYQWIPANLLVSNKGDSAFMKVPGNNTQYNLIYRDSVGCVQYDSIKVSIIDPLIGLIADTLVCKNSLLTITCKTMIPEVTYVWKPASNLVSQTGASATFTVDKPRYFYLDAKDNSGCIVKDSIYINTIENLFKIKADTLICKGDTVKLNGVYNAQITYSWTPTDLILSGGNTASPLVLGASNTLFKVKLTDNSGCITYDSVRVRTIDEIFKMIADTIVCKDEITNITCSANPQFTYEWLPATLVSSGANTNSVMMKIAYDGYYYIKIKNKNGCVYIDSIAIHHKDHDVHIKADTIVCIGDTTWITADNNPLYTLLWSPASKIISGKTSSYVIVKLDTTTLFYVNITDNEGCTTKDSIRIITLENSFRLIQFDTLVCKGDIVQIKAPADADLTYVWTPASNILSGANTPNPKVKVSSVFTVYLLVTDTSGCSAVDSLHFTPIENLMFMSADTTRCDRDTVKVSTLNKKEFKYNWTPANYVVKNKDSATCFLKMPSSQYVKVKIIDNSGCKVEDSIFISIRNTDVAIFGDTFICPGDTVLFTSPLYSTSSYAWTPLANIVSGANTHNPLVTATKDVNFKVLITDTTYCNITDSAKMYMINNENLNFINPDTTWCNSEIINLKVTDIGDVTYYWFPPNFVMSGQNTSNATVKIPKSQRIIVVVTDLRKGCQASDSVMLYIDTNHVKIIAKNDICTYDTSILRVNYIPKASYSWTPFDWIQNKDTMVKYYHPISRTYKVFALTQLFEQKCIYQDSVVLRIQNNLVDLKATADPSTLDYGDSTQLDAKASKAVSFIWRNDTTLSKLNIKDPTAFPKNKNMYYVTATDFYGCKKTDSVEVDVIFELCNESEVYIPNAFSPNGDGKNDVFRVRSNNIDTMYLAVYDRWGQLMFESRDQRIGWDGSYKGAEMEPAAYAFFLYAKCIGSGEISIKGNVTIVR